MNIPVAPSKKMDERIQFGNPGERKVIRMPAALRKEIDYEIGDYVFARDYKGAAIALAVEEAYPEDSSVDGMAAYVASEVFNLIVPPSQTVADVEPVQGITLGCDPELIIIDPAGIIIPGSAYFRKNDQIGYDGFLLEFRPLPSTCEMTVAYNIYSLLPQMRRKITDKHLRVIAVSAYHANARVTPKYLQYVRLTAGFHLHYGLPRQLLGWANRRIADQIVKVLDYYVGMPAIIPEGSADSYRRSVPYVEYGKPGTYRIDNRTLEYRVPGAILLRHPIWATGLLGLGAAVVEDIVARLRHSSDNFTSLKNITDDSIIRKLYPNVPPVMEIFRCICSPTAESARKHLDKIRADVSKMIGYPARARSINNFFNHLDDMYRPDIEHNWWRYYGTGQSESVDVLSASF